PRTSRRRWTCRRRYHRSDRSESCVPSEKKPRSEAGTTFAAWFQSGLADAARSGVAGELLPQGGQLLVAGQRTTGRLVGTRRAGGGPAGGLRLGGGELLHLRGVHLVPALRLGVAGLPLLTLLLEALEPFVGLGVEALGEDVVALLVVAVGHTVLRGVELLGVVLVGLLEAQRDTAPVQVDVDDLDHDVVADL